MAYVPIVAQIVDLSGNPVASCKANFYQAGTTTPQTTYTESTGTTAATNPVVGDAAGIFITWLDDTLTYKIVITDSAESTTYYSADNVNPSEIAGIFAIYTGVSDQSLLTTSSVTFANLTLTGDITSVGDDVTITDDLTVGGDINVTGTVDGVDIAAFKASYDASPAADANLIAFSAAFDLPTGGGIDGQALVKSGSNIVWQTTSGTTADAYLAVYETFADAKAGDLSNQSADAQVLVKGIPFYLDVSDTTTTGDDVRIIVDAGGARLKSKLVGDIDVVRETDIPVGPDLAGTADGTTFYQKAVDAAEAHGVDTLLHIPLASGVEQGIAIKTTDGVAIPSGVTPRATGFGFSNIFLDANCAFLIQGSNITPEGFYFDSVDASQLCDFFHLDSVNYKIENVTIDKNSGRRGRWGIYDRAFDIPAGVNGLSVPAGGYCYGSNGLRYRNPTGSPIVITGGSKTAISSIAKGRGATTTTASAHGIASGDPFMVDGLSGLSSMYQLQEIQWFRAGPATTGSTLEFRGVDSTFFNSYSGSGGYVLTQATHAQLTGQGFVQDKITTLMDTVYTGRNYFQSMLRGGYAILNASGSMFAGNAGLPEGINGGTGSFMSCVGVTIDPTTGLYSNTSWALAGVTSVSATEIELDTTGSTAGTDVSVGEWIYWDNTGVTGTAGAVDLTDRVWYVKAKTADSVTLDVTQSGFDTTGVSAGDFTTVGNIKRGTSPCFELYRFCGIGGHNTNGLSGRGSTKDDARGGYQIGINYRGWAGHNNVRIYAKASQPETIDGVSAYLDFDDGEWDGLVGGAGSHDVIQLQGDRITLKTPDTKGFDFASTFRKPVVTSANGISNWGADNYLEASPKVKDVTGVGIYNYAGGELDISRPDIDGTGLHGIVDFGASCEIVGGKIINVGQTTNTVSPVYSTSDAFRISGTRIEENTTATFDNYCYATGTNPRIENIRDYDDNSLIADYVVNTDVLVIDVSEQRLGLGTATPATRFHISNDNSNTIPTAGTVNEFTSFALTDETDSFGLYAGVMQSGNTWLQAQRGSGAATLYDIILQPNGGDVGIGDTTPSYTLDVAGDINSTGVLRVDGTQVVGNQGSAISDASGGATVDAEARTAINAALAALRTHGLIAT